MELLTVLTPTYNRGCLLGKLFSSLQAQQIQNFRWLIVDDGSTDDTRVRCEGFARDAAFPVEYIWKENGGKHTAVNIGIARIRTDLTIIVDSDDWMSDDATKVIQEEWLGQGEGRQSLYGMSFLKMDKSGKVVGKTFPVEREAETFLRMRINRNITGDKAEVWVSDTLKKHPFPVYFNNGQPEKLLGEALVWCRISRACPGQKMLFVNRAIYVCQYLEGGLTRGGRTLRVRNAKGGMAHALEMMYPDVILPLRIKNTLLFFAYGRCLDMGLKEILHAGRDRWLMILLAAPGCALGSAFRRMRA